MDKKKRDALKTRTRGQLIAAIRKEMGFSQEDLEEVSGVSKTQIGRIERGDVGCPGIITIRLLEDALGTPLLDLFTDIEVVQRTEDGEG